MKIQIKPFDVSLLRSDATLIVFGKRGNGMGCLAHRLLWDSCKSRTKTSLIAGPPLEVPYGLDSDLRVEALESKDVDTLLPRKWMDDPLDPPQSLVGIFYEDGSIRASPEIRRLFMNGRCNRNTSIHSISSPTLFPPELRCNTDYVICQWTSLRDDQEILWKGYGQFIPTFQDFEKIFRETTQEGGSWMVIDFTARRPSTPSIYFWNIPSSSPSLPPPPHPANGTLKDLYCLQPYKPVVVMGKRGSGKTVLTKALVDHFRGSHQDCILMSPVHFTHESFKASGFTEAYNDYNQGVVEGLIGASIKGKANPTLLVIEDTILKREAKSSFSTLVRSSLAATTTTILTLQYPELFSRSTRWAFSCIFVAKTSSEETLRHLWKHYASFFPSFGAFQEEFQRLTVKDYSWMVIDRTRENEPRWYSYTAPLDPPSALSSPLPASPPPPPSPKSKSPLIKTYEEVDKQTWLGWFSSFLW